MQIELFFWLYESIHQTLFGISIYHLYVGSLLSATGFDKTEHSFQRKLTQHKNVIRSLELF